MATTLTVYAYGNVDALHGIFNAVAMVMSSADFKDMMQIGVLIGFAVVATLAIFPQNLHKTWQWFASVAVLSGVMLVPKADVSIVDKLGQQPTVVVANVPWTLGLLASVKSSVGAALTDLFETAFQTIPSVDVALPSELSYLGHGVMFGARLVRESRNAEPLSLYAQGDLVQYVRNCIFPEQGRTASANAMEDSADLRSTYSGMNNPALSSTYHDTAAGNILVTATCDVVWSKLTAPLNSAGAEAIQRAAKQLLPDLYKVNPAAAIAQLDASLPAIYGKASLASAAATASDIMIQNIMINATAEASAIYGASLNDPSAIMFSAMNTQAVQQMNAGNMVQGRIAEEALPVVRNITEAILYAVFPVLCVLLVASEGKGLSALWKSYLYALVWVELWPPMFAIVNYLQTLEAAKTYGGAGYLAGGGSGLTLGTATPIFSASVSTLATTSWMVTFVPVIAAAVLFGFDKIMAITGAAGGGLRAAQSEAASATKGNFSAGNVSLQQQQLAAYRSDPMMYRTESVGGVEYRNVVNGQILGQYREASAPVSINDTVAMTRGMAAEASASVQQALRYGKAADAARDAAFTTALGAARSNVAAASRSLGWDVSRVGSDGVTSTEVDEVATRIAEKHGISHSSEVAKALTAGLSGLPIPVLGAQARTESSERLAKDVSAGVDSLQKLGSQRKHDLVEQFRHGDSFEATRRSNSEASQRVESSMRESQSYRTSEQAALDHSRQLGAKIEGAERFMRQSSANWANLLDQFARARHGLSVHEGIADPRRWQKIVQEFVAAGSIRTDTEDGKLMWIPPDPGLGPNAIAPSVLRQAEEVSEGGVGRLEQWHGDAHPAGGEARTANVRSDFDRRVQHEQRRNELTPDGRVSDQGLKTRTAAGQSNAAGTTAVAATRAREAQGSAQLNYDNQAERTRDAHQPAFSFSARNEALDAVKGTDGTPREFVEEAAAEQKKRDEASRGFHDRVGKTEIPTDRSTGRTSE